MMSAARENPGKKVTIDHSWDKELLSSGKNPKERVPASVVKIPNPRKNDDRYWSEL